jgi:cytochrome bd ubiquinol oxidase subunit I
VDHASALVLASDLLAARWLMALSLGFHIVLSCLGVALPMVIWIAHRRGLRDDDVDALTLARRWGKAAAVLFAIGAVSGTVLSFEMGLLWPGLMGPFGGVIGLPFALEGIFFFLEAIFLGIYLYGWKGLPARVHLATLIPVAISGVGGTFCILAVNGWMNEPTGFDRDTYLATGEVTDIDPWAAMFNGAVLPQFLHMLPATYLVTGFLVASVYAVGWLRGRTDRLHRMGATIGLTVGAIAAPVMLVTGDLAARNVAADQPIKFAAIELLPETTAGAPFTLGGVLVDGEVRGAIEIPRATSLLQEFDPDATITGLDAAPEELRPPANIVHLSFQLMVGIGLALIALSTWSAWIRRRSGDWPVQRLWWRALALAGPAAVLALELGWTTTEVGRQPWIAQNVLLVEDAVTTRTGIGWSLAALMFIYIGLAGSGWFVLHQLSVRWRRGEDPATPYGPRESVSV